MLKKDFGVKTQLLYLIIEIMSCQEVRVQSLVYQNSVIFFAFLKKYCKWSSRSQCQIESLSWKHVILEWRGRLSCERWIFFVCTFDIYRQSPWRMLKNKSGNSLGFRLIFSNFLVFNSVRARSFTVYVNIITALFCRLIIALLLQNIMRYRYHCWTQL